MKLLLFIIVGFCMNCLVSANEFIYASEVLKIQKLTEHTYRHISYHKTQSFGKVANNGMLVIDANDALVVDSPVNREATTELIKWLMEQQKYTINAVLVTHFHADSLGDLQSFHDKKIPSYAHAKTVELARENNLVLPKNIIKKDQIFTIGKKKIVSDYLGEGHTQDNSVVYVMDDRVLFGGCLIKSIKAGKGYLGDANVAAWSDTVSKLKQKYLDVKLVVPGHGNSGGIELLDYTINMFHQH